MSVNCNKFHFHYFDYLNSSYNYLTLLAKKKPLQTESKDLHSSVDLILKDLLAFLFSLRFFLIAIIFLIFDVEITLLLSLTTIITFTNVKMWTVTGLFFLLILLLGLYHEWMQGALKQSE